MNMNEFSKILAGNLKERGITATPTETSKNGVVQHGLTLRRGEERICPIIYLNHFWSKYQNGELSTEDILNSIIVEYQSLPTPTIPDLQAMMSAPDFIDRINLRMLNMKRNREMIRSRNLVFHEIEDTDLVALFYFTCIEEGSSSGTIGITEELLQRYLPDVQDGDDLFEIVINRKNSDVKLESIGEVIQTMVTENAFMLPPLEDGLMYVLSNGSRCYGAGAILTEEARKLILERFPDGNVTILPSSTHETILIATTPDENLEVLRKMVMQVNSTEVSPEEYLSDQVYHYDANTGELSIAE